VERAVNKLTLRMPHQLFIGGMFVDAEGAKTYDTINPTDGSVSATHSRPLASRGTARGLGREEWGEEGRLQKDLSCFRDKTELKLPKEETRSLPPRTQQQ
jgi:hypothetical protein